MKEKTFKKIVALILCGSIFLGISATAFATESSDSNLLSIAQDTISEEVYTNEFGAVITTYTNLDTFIDTVHLTNPEFSDYDIAIFILQYTGQSYEGLPEGEILNILTLNNLTTSSSYITVKEDGSTTISNDDVVLYDDWLSNDGYMKITTNYSYIKTVGREKYYQVMGMATWLKYPAMALQDTFVVGTNGTFDASYSEYANVNQRFKCLNSCETPFTYLTRSVTRTNPTDLDLSLTYKSFVPVMNFIPHGPRCNSCPGPSVHDMFHAYLRYGVLADESINIQAGYAHKTFGIGNISVGIDATGAPNFSIGITGTISEYIARPITINY